MIKKVFMIFAFILFVFGITKVQAVSKGDVIKPKVKELEKLIQTNISGKWEYLKVEEYSANGMPIYKIGNKEEIVDTLIIDDEKGDKKLKNIIKSGYKSKSLLELGVDTDEDAYIATKIAIDCIYNNYSEEIVDTYYRIGENLEENKKTKAKKILNLVKKLLKNANDEKNIYIIINRIGNLEIDDVRDNYCSQTYEVKLKEADLLNYEIIKKEQSNIEYFIADIGTGESKESFDASNPKFKVMIKDEDKSKKFEIHMSIKAYFNEDKIFVGAKGENKYIINAKIEENKNFSFTIFNGESNVAINFIDEETKEKVYGCIVQIDNKNYIIDNEDKILFYGLGEGCVFANFVYIPNEYISPKDGYKIDVQDKENHIENIELKRKKGSLLVETNLKASKYEVYNLKSECIGEYITDEKGSIYIDKIDIGEYILKNKEVATGYKLVDDIRFSIKYDITKKINIINEKKNVVEENKPGDKQTEKEVEEITDDKNNNSQIDNKNSDNKGNTVNSKNEAKEKQENEQNVEKIEKQVLKLPRTGKDYFILKLIIVNLSIFLVFEFLLLKKLKKTDC